MLEWVVSKVRPVERLWEDAKRDQLSNSGDILKLLVPNYNRNIICSGWRLKVLENTMMIIIRWSIVFNHSCKVISLKMIVIEIDNRGSKSKVSSNTFVKEQRADGSWQVKFNQALLSSRCLTCLRCTLMGFERNRVRALFLGQSILNIRNNQIRFLSKQKNFMFFSSQESCNDEPSKRKKIILNSSWVTGFSDGEGCFHLKSL